MPKESDGGEDEREGMAGWGGEAVEEEDTGEQGIASKESQAVAEEGGTCVGEWVSLGSQAKATPERDGSTKGLRAIDCRIRKKSLV